MRIDGNGKYYAETPEEMQLLMQMALQGGGASPQLSKNNNYSPLEIFGALSATYPGNNDMFGMNPVDVDLGGSSKPSIGSQVKGATSKATSTAKNSLDKALAFADDIVKPKAKQTLAYVDDLVTPVAKQAQLAALNATGGVGAGGKAGGVLSHLGRFAASPKALMLAKAGTGIGALGAVLGAADVLVGRDSLANKAMDTVAMGIGGTLGAVGGPLGAAAGAGIGKTASDALQFVFGGGKSAEQRKMEETLALLRSRGLV